MTHGLERFREERAADMEARVTRALREFDAQGKPINISRIAAHAAVSRQWLYNSRFRPEIERLRQRHTTSPSRGASPSRTSTTEASLRAQIEAFRARTQELRSENAELREELARALGLLRNLA